MLTKFIKTFDVKLAKFIKENYIINFEKQKNYKVFKESTILR